jgi:hypothetical protein
MGSEVSTMLIEFVVLQTGADNTRMDLSERAFQRASELRALLKRWDEAGPHSADWTKELRDRSQSANAELARVRELARAFNLVRRERNEVFAASAKKLAECEETNPVQLLSEMNAVYRHELEVDLPPILALFNDVENQASEIEAFVESCLRTTDGGRSAKWFGRKNSD